MAESNLDKADLPSPEIAPLLRLAATWLRIIFMLLLGAVTLRVALPERETVFSAYVPWENFVRRALGLAVCMWLAMRLFKGPETIRGYWVWLYVGLFAVPFALICLIAVW